MAASGIMISFDVLTAAPADVGPCPVLASALVKALRAELALSVVAVLALDAADDRPALAAAAAVDDAWAYAQQRKQFGKLICAHQSVRHALVEAKTKLQACRHMIYHAAALANAGAPCSVETSMAKLFVGDTAVEIVLACQRVMGAYGCAEGFDMERYVRDICIMPIVGGSSNMQKNNIAARLRLPE